MRKIILTIAAMSMLLSSCTKDESRHCRSYTFTINGELEEMTVGQDTKVTLAHTMRMTWTKGDEVSVINLTKGTALGGTLTADQSEIRSTFSGTVTGSIDNGDILALIYPDLGFTTEQTFANATVDFSSQDGYDSNAKFCAVATITADTSNGTFVEADTHFYMKSGMIYITLADLPASTRINEVSIPDLYSQISLSINSSKDGITFSGTTGVITMTPPDNSKSNTSIHGTKGLYFGLGGASAVSERRTVSVTCGGDLYESTMTGSAIGAKFYTLSVGAFEQKPLTSGFNLNYDDTEMGDGDTVSIGGGE